MRSLSRKITLYLLVLWGGVAVVGFLGYMCLNAVHRASNDLIHSVYPSAEAALRVENAIYNAYQNTVVYCSYLHSDAKTEAGVALEQADQALAQYLAVTQNASEKQLTDLQMLLDDAKKHAVDCIQMTDMGMTPEEFQTHIGELTHVQLQVVLALRNAVAHEQQGVLASTQQIREEVDRGLIIFIGGAVVLLVTTLVIIYRLSETILPPVAALTEAAELFSKKNLHVRVNKDLPGEFGVLANAFNDMVLRIHRALEENENLLKEVTQSQKKYQDLYDHAPDGYCSLASDGTILEMNETELKRLGYRRLEVVGTQNMKDVVDISSVDVFQKAFQVLRESGKMIDVELVFKRTNGSTYPVRVNSTAVFGSDGVFQYCRCSVRDITKEKDLYRQLLQSQKLESLGTLSSGIAHDFNNLLTSMMGFSQLSMMQIEPDSQAYQNLDRVVKLGNQAAGLTRQLLTFSRQTTMNKNIISLGPIVKETVKVIERTFPEIIRIESNIDPHVSNIEADATQIQQVLMNLCVNARDAMSGGGSLTLSLTETDDIGDKIESKSDSDTYVCLSVKDTGAGIPNDIRERIFEPFFTTKEVGKGTGLGLSIVHGIIESHNGHIEINTAEGQGTEFLIYLPAVAENIQEHITETISKPGSETILLVEDDANVQEVTHDMLVEQGYRVLVTSQGAEGLEMFKKHYEDIDLVLTDVMMPEMDGLTLCSKIEQFAPQCKVLLMSGYEPSGEDTSQIIRGFLCKPFETQQLTEAVRKALESVALPV